jgi:hypothetical protein
LKGRNQFRDLFYSWEDRINRYLEEMKCEGIDFIQLAQDRVQRQGLVIMILPRDGV